MAGPLDNFCVNPDCESLNSAYCRTVIQKNIRSTNILVFDAAQLAIHFGCKVLPARERYFLPTSYGNLRLSLFWIEEFYHRNDRPFDDKYETIKNLLLTGNEPPH